MIFRSRSQIVSSFLIVRVVFNKKAQFLRQRGTPACLAVTPSMPFQAVTRVIIVDAKNRPKARVIKGAVSTNTMKKKYMLKN